MRRAVVFLSKKGSKPYPKKAASLIQKRQQALFGDGFAPQSNGFPMHRKTGGDVAAGNALLVHPARAPCSCTLLVHPARAPPTPK